MGTTAETPSDTGKSALKIRRWVAPLALCLPVLLLWPPCGKAYGVLTHHQLIDQAWNTVIVPILLNRFPSLTTEQLREAHAYAYGGCIVQDFGYYPFANAFFSDLTHYVRTGDFVQKLFQHAKTANEFAFAIGALSHYVGDSIGHSQATNTSVAIMFPKLAAKYGSSVNYAQGKNEHSQVEWAFDTTQAAKLRLAPAAYVQDVGLEVPREQLAAAFYETYGIPLREIVSGPLPAMKTFRFGGRSFLPNFTYAQAVLHKGRLPADTPGPELEQYERQIAQLPKEEGWDQYRRKPGIRIHLSVRTYRDYAENRPAPDARHQRPDGGDGTGVHRERKSLHRSFGALPAAIDGNADQYGSGRPRSRYWTTGGSRRVSADGQDVCPTTRQDHESPHRPYSRRTQAGHHSLLRRSGGAYFHEEKAEGVGGYSGATAGPHGYEDNLRITSFSHGITCTKNSAAELRR